MKDAKKLRVKKNKISANVISFQKARQINLTYDVVKLKIIPAFAREVRGTCKALMILLEA